MNINIIIWMRWVVKCSLKGASWMTSLIANFLEKCDQAWSEDKKKATMIFLTTSWLNLWHIPNRMWNPRPKTHGKGQRAEQTMQNTIRRHLRCRGQKMLCLKMKDPTVCIQIYD